MARIYSAFFEQDFRKALSWSLVVMIGASSISIPRFLIYSCLLATLVQMKGRQPKTHVIQVIDSQPTPFHLAISISISIPAMDVLRYSVGSRFPKTHRRSSFRAFHCQCFFAKRLSTSLYFSAIAWILLYPISRVSF